jgi:hypothetical protein
MALCMKMWRLYCSRAWTRTTGFFMLLPDSFPFSQDLATANKLKGWHTTCTDLLRICKGLSISAHGLWRSPSASHNFRSLWLDRRRQTVNISFLLVTMFACLRLGLNCCACLPWSESGRVRSEGSTGLLLQDENAPLLSRLRK